MGRSRTGTSEINRRKFVAKAKTSAAPQAAPQVAPATNNRIVQGSSGVNAAGLVVAAPGAAARASGEKPVSSTIDGKAIKVDDEGRMDLTEIAKMDIFSAGARGAVVPTEQMVGVVKDVAYGVASEDQRTMESGLDLLLNPVMKPFVDERMKTEGVISEEWYWPEELKSNWKVLPGFMQKSDRVETRSFIDGASANVGNIGAIAQSPLAHKISADELAESEKRFNTSSGTQAYYIGSALGEIPYFIIGAGQVKAVGTVAAKATAGVVRGASIANTAKVMSTAYKIERATEKLQKVARKANDVVDQSKIISRPEVLRAVKLLKDGYAINVRAQTKTSGMTKEVKSEAAEISQKLVDDSTTLNKFTADKMNKIEAMPETTNKLKLEKMKAIDDFNVDVQEHLLPDMKKFKDGYVAQAQKTASNTKVERLASAIGGSPKDMSRRMDAYFNKVRKDKGDTDKTNEQFFRDEMAVKEARGEFAGVMGNIKFNRYLFGNTMNTALGISRTQNKAKDIIEKVQAGVVNVRIVKKDQLLAGKKAFEDLVIKNEREIKVLKKENIKLKKIQDKGDALKITSQESKEFKPLMERGETGIKSRIAENLEEMAMLKKEADTAKQTIKQNDADLIRALSYTKKGKKKKYETDDQQVYRFDFEIYQKAYGEKVETILPAEIIMASKPSVSVRKVRGRWEGQIGDTKETSKTFFVDQIPRSEAIERHGLAYVSKNPAAWKSLGFRKVGKYKTVVPKKVEPMEDIVYMYEATDSLRAAGRSKSGVKPVLVMDTNISVLEKSLLKKEYGLGMFTGDRKVGQAISHSGQRAVFEYKPISNDMVGNIKRGQVAAKMDGQDVTDILINRAELENRPKEYEFFARLKSDEIEKQKITLDKTLEKKLQNLFKNKRMKPSTRDRKTAKIMEQHETKMTSLTNRQKSLKAKLDMDPAERRSLEMNLQIHRTADQKGTVTAFPLAVLGRSSDNYRVKYESDMVRNKDTGKDYYLREAADGTTDYYEILDDSFRPSMVADATTAAKPKNWDSMDRTRKLDFIGKEVRLATKYYVNPKDIGPATKTPYRQASLEESYSVAVMEKGTRVKWVGNDRSTWNIALKQYELDGKWVDAKDPDYRMGLDFEEVMNKGNLPKGSAEPDGSKGFVITNTKTGKVKWDDKPKETDISGKSIGQKSDDDVMHVDMNTVSYGLASQMRKNLLFLDPDITVTVKRNFIGPVEPVPYQGMLKKLSPEEKAVLESGSTIGSRQAKIQRKLNQVNTTDADLYLAGGRKLSEDEKSLWKRTGKLSTDKDAPYYEMDYAKKNTGQLVKQNVGIVSGKGMLKALRTVSETKGKLKDKAFGSRFVPLESKSLAPDASTYSQFVERDIGQLPYGKSVRTTGFDDNVSALFAVSQSDSMVQGQMGGGIIVTPVQEAMSTARIIRENPLTAGQANFGKGLEANKGSNYDRMLAQARGKDANNFGGGTVERDFKERMVEQIYSKILKKEKPKPEAMNLYLEAGSPQYTKLIDDTVRTNNSNLKRMSKKETVKMNIKNKGRKVKKEVINPDSFEKIIGKVNLDTRNPIRRVTDAFKYRTQYRTEPEFFKEGSTYVVDGKTSSQYRPSKTDTGSNIKRPGWFGRLAEGIGDRRKNNYQVTESKMAFQRQALREVLAEPIFQPYIGTDKTITRLYDDVMSMGETSFEGSVESVLRGQTDTANMSKNVQLNKLLGRLEATQLRLDKRIGKDKDKAKHQNVDRDRTTTTTTFSPKENIYGADWNQLTSKQRAFERYLDLEVSTLGPEKSIELKERIEGTTKYLSEITPKLNKAKEQRDVYGKMVSTGEMTSKRWDGKATTRKLDKQEMIDAKNNLKAAKEDFDDLTNQLSNPDYLSSLKKIKELEAERKTKTDAIENRKANKTEFFGKTKTTKNTVINTNTVTLGPDVPPQFYIDSQINAKKIREVKAEIAKSATDPDFDLARQSGDANERFSNLGMTERTYTFKDGNMKVNSPPPKNTWADNRIDSDGAESQDAWYNVGTDIWKSPGNEDQRIRLGTSETANVLEPDFSLPEGGAFIDGTKPSPTTDTRLSTLDEVKESTRGFLMRQTGLIGDGGETSMSRKAVREAKPGNLDWMLEPIEKSSKKKLTNVIDASNPVKSLAAYLDNAENTKQFSTPAFKDASEKLQTKQVQVQSSKNDTYSRGSSEWGTQSGFAIESSRVSKMDMDQVRQGIRADNKPDGVGIKQQVPLASSLATSIGELFKPSETTATDSQPLFSPLPTLTLNQASAQMPEKNILEQTIGDIQKTISSVEAGNNRIGAGADGTVKSYEMANSLNIFGDAGRTMIDTSISQKQNTVPDLLSGLNLGQAQPQKLDEGLITTTMTNQFSMQIQQTRQSQLYKGVFNILPKPRTELQPMPISSIRPKPIPQRVMPIAPLFPIFDPVEGAKNRRSRMKKKKSKKTWWQTPENWYEPYYWGGKDQTGSGYVTFTGKEPGKVKRYEKRHFGIGVNDSPFNIRSKWF